MFQHIQLFKAITAVKWEALQYFNERMTFIKKTWHFQSNFALHLHVLQICIMHILVKYSELCEYSGDRSYIWILERNMDKFWPLIKRDQVYFQIGSWWKPVIQSFRPKGQYSDKESMGWMNCPKAWQGQLWFLWLFEWGGLFRWQSRSQHQ